MTNSDWPLVSQLRHHLTLTPLPSKQTTSWALYWSLSQGGFVGRNQVTCCLMAITVIIAGIVNCFCLGLMKQMGWCRAISRDAERWRWERAMFGRTYGENGEFTLTGGRTREWGTVGLNCQSRLWFGGADASMWKMNFMPVDSEIPWRNVGVCSTETGSEQDRVRRRTDTGVCAETQTDKTQTLKIWVRTQIWVRRSYSWSFDRILITEKRRDELA